MQKNRKTKEQKNNEIGSVKRGGRFTKNHFNSGQISQRTIKKYLEDNEIRDKVQEELCEIKVTGKISRDIVKELLKDAFSFNYGYGEYYPLYLNYEHSYLGVRENPNFKFDEIVKLTNMDFSYDYSEEALSQGAFYDIYKKALGNKNLPLFSYFFSLSENKIVIPSNKKLFWCTNQNLNNFSYIPKDSIKAKSIYFRKGDNVTFRIWEGKPLKSGVIKAINYTPRSYDITDNEDGKTVIFVKPEFIYPPTENTDTKILELLSIKALAEIEMMELEFQMQKSIVVTKQTHSNSPFDQRTAFINQICTDFQNMVVHNKPSYEKLARSFGIDNQNEAKELVELAIVLESRRIIEREEKPYSHLVDLYNLQPNLLHRTSNSIDKAQYSTPAPISYLAGLYVKSNNQYPWYYEPTAGNGLLTIALPYSSLVVNELDPIRLEHLERQPFSRISNQDATKYVPSYENINLFDGMICNPPFGEIDSHISEYELDNYKIVGLEHYIAIKALKLIKDDGKASIIVGNHTSYDKKQTKGKYYVKGGKDRYFLNYLYHFYNVEDIIPIDGHKLYSRQGTAFNTRLILINGRKKEPKGFAFKTSEVLDEVVTDFYELEKRIMKLL